MSIRRSFESYSTCGLLVVFTRYRSRISTSSPCNTFGTLVAWKRYGYSLSQGLLQLISSADSGGFNVASEGIKMYKGNSSSLPPQPVPVTSKPKFSTWVKWVLGSIFSLFLPFWKIKFNQLLKLEDEVEIVAEEVENVAEVVAKVATLTEKLSEAVADELPDDGKLKEAALWVERVSEEAAKGAHLAQHFIHKVSEVKQEVETPLSITKTY